MYLIDIYFTLINRTIAAFRKQVVNKLGNPNVFDISRYICLQKPAVTGSAQEGKIELKIVTMYACKSKVMVKFHAALCRGIDF